MTGADVASVGGRTTTTQGTSKAWRRRGALLLFWEGPASVGNFLCGLQCSKLQRGDSKLQHLGKIDGAGKVERENFAAIFPRRLWPWERGK